MKGRLALLAALLLAVTPAPVDAQLITGGGGGASCGGGACAPAGLGAVITSSPTTTAADWAACKVFTINGSSINIPIPAASSLGTGGCFVINNPSANTFTVTPNGTDNLNGANAAKTYLPGTITVITTDGSTNDYAALTPGIGVTTLAISTATFTPDGSNYNYKILLVHASCPCTLANPSVTPVVGSSGVIEVDQSATGSDTIGTWGANYFAPGGTSTITLSAGANARDFLGYTVASDGKIIINPSALNVSH